MEGTFHEPEELDNGQLRTLYRNLCSRLGEKCTRADKMGRNELLSRVKKLLALQDSKKPAKPAGTVRPVKSSKIEECFNVLLEALRMYVKYVVFSHGDSISAKHASVCLSEARKLCEEAVGLAIDCAGNGWDRASRVFNVVDRALLKMRTDFSDALVSNCVMASLLSDSHQAEISGK